jgi:hypothetical protein
VRDAVKAIISQVLFFEAAACRQRSDGDRH